VANIQVSVWEHIFNNILLGINIVVGGISSSHKLNILFFVVKKSWVYTFLTWSQDVLFVVEAGSSTCKSCSLSILEMNFEFILVHTFQHLSCHFEETERFE